MARTKTRAKRKPEVQVGGNAKRSSANPRRTPDNSPIDNSTQERAKRSTVVLAKEPMAYRTIGDKKIGVALDFSPNSKKALQWAIENLVRQGDALYLIHVLDHKDEYETDPLRQNWLQTGAPMQAFCDFKDQRLMAKNYGLHEDYAEVIEIIENMYYKNSAYVLMKLYYGDAREKLCKAVEDINLDHIVMGRRGTGQARVLEGVSTGSVSSFVLTNTSCSGIVIKG